LARSQAAPRVLSWEGGVTIAEMVQFLRSMNPDASVESVIAFKCGRCDGAPHAYDRLEMSGPRHSPTMPQPLKRGVENVADREQIEGIPSNSDVRSWCWHNDTDVTLEVLQAVTVPIDLARRLGAIDEPARGSAIIEHLGTVIFQTMQSVGFHCGEVEICQKQGGAQMPSSYRLTRTPPSPDVSSVDQPTP
jgi:hypothetical protein